RNRVGLTPVGSQVEIAYLRDGRRGSATIRIEAEGSGGSEATPGRLQGAEFQDVKGNVVIAAVEEGSAAARFGLRTGDVVVAVNRQPVSTVAELTAGATSASANRLLVDDAASGTGDPSRRDRNNPAHLA
ncbi:MAG: PDZ domain-containing protein, partial [Mesorhizobium sp.]